MKSHLDYNVPIINSNNLPSYPIPNMKETFEHFLEWVKPLISDEEYLNTSNLVKAFIKSDDSKKLHKKLEELGNRDNDNWIFDYWFKSYLKMREPFVPHISVPMIYENLSLKDSSVIEKATSIIYAVANSYSSFKENGTSDYSIGKKRYSNDQFHGTLASINHIKRDINEYYINSNFSTNVVVLYKNHIYSLDVFDRSKKVSSIDAIYNAVKEIYSETIKAITPNINFVTAEPNKDTAGDYLSHILKDDKNNTSYQKIKDSIFILNLDSDNPDSVVDKLYGACMDTEHFNRWHGKGLEFSISKNGIISFIVDHSFSDAGTAIYLADQIDSYIKDIEFTKESHKVAFSELSFYLDDEINSKLIRSFEDYKVAMNSFKGRYVELEHLSRADLKEKGILSGDGFFHIALQAAQKMTYDEIYNTYVSVDMRMYFKGRTESNHPVTDESIEFVEALLNLKKDKIKLKDLLHKALDAHYNRTVLCTTGKGVDRYLYVLEQLYIDFKDELDISKKTLLFDSVAYETIKDNKISATSFSHENLKYSYFPPVTKDGLGVYYVVGDKSFAIITAFNENVKMMLEFNENLKTCVNMMLDIVSF